MNIKLLKNEIIAGIAIAVVTIPQAIAYSAIAGVPPQYGLLAAIIPVVIASYFGSSKHLSTGPTAMVALLTFSSVNQLATPLSSIYVEYAAILALLVGFIQILLSITKSGKIINFIAHPVILGFSSSAALIIGLSQIPKLLGINIDTNHGFIEIIYQLIHSPISINSTVAIWGAFSLIILILQKKYFSKYSKFCLINYN